MGFNPVPFNIENEKPSVLMIVKIIKVDRFVNIQILIENARAYFGRVPGNLRSLEFFFDFVKPESTKRVSRRLTSD